MDDTTFTMTELMFRCATDKSLTLEEAKKLLLENCYIRSLRETLAKYFNIDINNADMLEDEVRNRLYETDPTANRDTIARTVGRWVNGVYATVSKENAIKVAFALKLNFNDTEELMRRMSGKVFHLRSPKDIVWKFAIESGMNYTDACSLVREMTEYVNSIKLKSDDSETRTNSITKESEKVSTKEELKAFLKEQAPHLGTFHNTAYYNYTHFMALLKRPPIEYDLGSLHKLMPKERTMSDEEIALIYLFRKFIPNNYQNNDVLQDAVRRSITQNWPSADTIRDMNNRITDVTRKVLILLFLACDGESTEYGASEKNDYSCDVDPAVSYFDSVKMRLSAMLSDCGFAQLDPRIPFDWMTLFCMTVEDPIEIDERISAFLSGIFPPENNGDDE